MRRVAWQRFKLGLVVLSVLLTLGLLTSLAVAYQLTRRRQPFFPEPLPIADWGRFESHRLKTSDDQEIGAWFVPGASDAPAIVLVHGSGARRSACLSRAKILASQGCAVLMITLRAHGDSTGDFNDIGYSARHDVVAAVAFLERQLPGKPVVVHGMSMGGAAAVFAFKELGDRVSGYTLESPYRDLKTAVWNRLENALPPILDRVVYLGLLAASHITLPDLRKISPIDAISGIPSNVRVLILAGGEDPVARPDEVRAVFDRVRSHAKLVLFEHAGHMNFLETNAALYQQSVLGFLGDIRRERD
jgi:alpha-beta hydrolase superfamily lysophospholipase